MNKDAIKQCTRCGSDFEDMRIEVNLRISVDRKTESHLWEKISNADVETNELLCQRCFDEFTDSISKAMNQE